ncbi:poly-gamma-glutamate hydrolase family protein [Streptomyces sp. NPDC001339]|uniref:poly-gamma-glutamate hydrolase family protein n=1 Tax=Streptomyces sp. NPDC001339 TaxID=3364563 RepID=UPI003678AACC
MATSHTTRRTVLSAFAAATAAPLLTSAWGAGEAHASGIGDTYRSSTDLYTKLPDGEGTEYARRYKRHEMTDNDIRRSFPYNRTMIMAMHGGGIEPGTSELCLGIAGYDPGGLAVRPAGGPVYDYWMFEGLRKPSKSQPKDAPSNRELHVTAKNCDDHVALSMAASSLNVLSLHGCTAEQAGAPAKRPEAVVIGGRNTAFQRYLTEELRGAGFQTVDGATKPDLNGDHVDNPCNRTMLGKGGQLEITTELRKSMFDGFTLKERPTSTNDTFRRFTDACRAAIARLEAGPDQVIL